jgi:hypothetical protein
MNPTLSARIARRAKLLLCALAATALAACGVGQDGTGATPDTQATGVVTGFGSVIVDGVHYDVSAAAISTDGSTGRSQSDLRVGMVVTVTGTLAADGSSGTASQVAYESLLRGAVDETPGLSALRVLGQRIAVDSTTVFEGVDSLGDLRAADALEVSGFTDPAGGFRATWIRKESSASAPQLTGFISQVNGSVVSLAGLNVNLSNATLVGVTLNTLATGQRVRVQLQAPPSAGAAVASRLVLLGNGLEGALRRQAIQGLVNQWNSVNQTFLLDGQRVRLDAATQFQDGGLTDIGNGARVRVLGTRGSDGTLTAERVLIYRPAIDGYVRGRVTAIDRAALRFTVQVASGVQVQVRATTVLSDLSLANNLTFANLTVGDEVLALGWLSGTRLDAGLVQRLPLIATGVGIGGPVSNFNAGTGTLTILGVTVGTNTAGAQFFDAQGGSQTQAQFFAALAADALVRAEGAMVGNVLVANTVRRVP